MKINKISGYMLAGLMAVSCGRPSGSEKAIGLAGKYLDGKEINIALNNIGKIRSKTYNRGSSVNMQNTIYYWDSITAVNKEKEGFKAGYQMIKDSIEGRSYRKPYFELTLDGDTFVEKVAEEDNYFLLEEVRGRASKYYSGDEFLKLKQDEPSIKMVTGNYRNILTDYFGNLAIEGAERKGFLEGAQSARDEFRLQSDTVSKM